MPPSNFDLLVMLIATDSSATAVASAASSRTPHPLSIVPPGGVENDPSRVHGVGHERRLVASRHNEDYGRKEVREVDGDPPHRGLGEAHTDTCMRAHSRRTLPRFLSRISG